MKYLKKFFLIVSAGILCLTLVVIVLLALDTHNTKYLTIENIPGCNTASYLIANINIVPMTKDTILAHKMVFVMNGIIEHIADSIDMEGVEIIDGENHFMSPGLIDMHVHVWDKYELGLYLANGVTTLRNLWGMPQHLRMRKEINEGKIIGPMFFTSSPKLTGKSDPGADKIQISTPEEAKKSVIQYQKRGYDFIKIYAGLTGDLFEAIKEQSKISGISIVSHPSREIPYLSQFIPQVSSLEHAEEIVQQALDYRLDSFGLEVVIQQFVLSGKSFCPTLTGYYKIFEMLEKGQHILNADPVHYINPLIQTGDSKVQYKRWEDEKEHNNLLAENIYEQHLFHLYIVNRMVKSGVNVVCGTDAGIGVTAPGYSIHEELAMYREAGMSNYEALKTATINPTKTHEEFKQLGTIEQGKYANFIITAHNPLENLGVLSHPEWVMIKGRKLTKSVLKQFTDEARDRSNLLVTALHYAEYILIEKWYY